jgi:hypothetical protein
MRPVSLAVLTSLTFAAEAHHSPASFDQSAEVLVEGTVTELTWANPHVYFAVASVNAAGERVVQPVEAVASSALTTWGVTRESFRTGDRVRVRANPSRRGAGHTVLGLELTRADGSVLPLHPRAARSSSVAASAATSILGTWVGQPEGFAALPPAVRRWPFTERAREILSGDRGDVAAANGACVPVGLPGLMIYPVTKTLAARDGDITIAIDWLGGVERTVHLDEPHPANVERSLLGHSVGRWEGSALLVDTVGFTPQAQGTTPEFPSSEAKHVMERFSLSDDRKHVEYEATVEDPVYLTTPVTINTRWDYRPGQVTSAEPCDRAVAQRYLSE